MTFINYECLLFLTFLTVMNFDFLDVDFNDSFKIVKNNTSWLLKCLHLSVWSIMKGKGHLANPLKLFLILCDSDVALN